MRPEPDANIPKEIASAVNLLAHPAAGVMALSALSAGVASQMMGAWLGAMTGAVQAAQRIAAAVEPEPEVSIADFAEEPGVQAAAPANVTVLAERRAKNARPVKQATARAKNAPAAKLAQTVEREETAPARPRAMERPATPDDLKLISGVGPKLEKVLNELGIWTFGQIAGWTPSEVDWIDHHLSFGGRIGRDDWVAQADRLARGGA